MKATIVVAWMLCLMATWLWFGSTTFARSLMLEDNYKNTSYLKEYPKLTFNAGEADESSYGEFIAKLRELVKNPGDSRHGIPVLHETVSIDQRFVLLELTSWSEYSITVAVNVTNLYIVGYLAENNFFYFPPEYPFQEEQLRHLFPGAQRRVPLTTLGVSYGSLARVAGEGRAEIDLGHEPLNTAIDRLYERYNGRTSDSSLARSFIVILQMISEAARFPVIEGAMRVRIQTNTPEPPHGNMIALENDWDPLSGAVQNSNQGAFPNGVQLINEEANYITVYDAASLIPFIAIMLFRCNPQTSLLIRNVVPNFVGDEDVCFDPEPTLRIVGLNGLCLDVFDGDYHNGNKIILWPCKSNTDPNQLWTLKTDDTIRSNGKCLTTYGYSAGDYVMIYDCESAVADATHWRIAVDGTIINPISNLVLTATGGTPSEGQFMVRSEVENFGTRQSWRPTNNTQPFVGHIIGFKSLCLEGNETDIWLEKCVNDKNEQKWARYVDGTIRPKLNQNKCLTSVDENRGSLIRILPLDPGSNLQRWVYKNDRTFRNLYFGMVLDVRGSDPSLKQIIMWPSTGNPNQKWFPML